MKYALLSLLNMTFIAHGMEQNITNTRDEWNAEAYSRGNFVQQNAALQILEQQGQKTFGDVIDIGSGTGNISYLISHKAKSVCGVDPSKSMHDYSVKQYTKDNLRFINDCMENVQMKEEYDLATLFFSYHWIKDKRKALEQTHSALKTNGEMLITFIDACDKPLFNRQSFYKTFPAIECILKMMEFMNITIPPSFSYQTADEFKKTVTEAGFEIISFKHEPCECILTKKEIKDHEYSLIANIPIVSALPEWITTYFFNQYIDSLIDSFSTDSRSERYIYPRFENNYVMHAKKQ